MAQLAIKGHKTRGKEVIKILEMLGYVNYHKYSANTDSLCLYGGENTSTIYYDWVNNCEDMHVFALEEFLEKYPYKVGDKVQHRGATSCGSVYEVEKMRWVDDHVEYEVKRLWCWNDHYTFTAEDLQPFKEETMEENLTIQDVIDNNAEWLLNKLQEMSAKNVLQTISDLYDELHKPPYPKTYEECCEVLKTPIDNFISKGAGYKAELLSTFQKLLICRDAYWKTGNWRPDFTNDEQDKFTILVINDDIEFNCTDIRNCLLTFPTSEMRDAFYENFKYLIEQCKELL